MHNFLVDSGSEVTIIPLSLATDLISTTKHLQAANGSEITTYGESRIRIVLNKLRREFMWTCVVAKVTTPILGADFLVFFDITINLKRRTLRDGLTGLSSPCQPCTDSDFARICPITVTEGNIPGPMARLLRRFPELSSEFTAKNRVIHNTKHVIDTSGPPLTSKVRPIYGQKLKAATEEFKQLEKLGIVKRSSSPWAAPIHLVPKGEGWRICGDYRRLNSVTTPDCYPMRNINQLYTKLYGAKVFSTIDLVRAYNQIEVKEDSIPKTAVITPSGLFEYRRMPFGLRNASQTFQRFMDEILGHLDFVFTYIDDVLVFSQSESDHMNHLEQVFQILKDNGLTIGLKKCAFTQTTVKFLGYEICEQGIQPCRKKCEVLSTLQLPETSAELHRFLGSVGFYRKHIANFAEHAATLHDMINAAATKTTKFNWTDDQVLAFEHLKKNLNEIVVHSFINPNSNEFIITTDASKRAIGGALHQISKGEQYLIQFYSRKLSDAETRYSTFDRELLAAHDSVQFFLPYIDGQHSTLFTDHQPIAAAFRKKSDCKSDRQSRHLSFLSEHVVSVEYIKGKQNTVADFLSRKETTRVSAIKSDVFDIASLTEAQKSNIEIQELMKETEQFKIIRLRNSEVLCESSGPNARPVVPLSLRRSVFDSIHSLGHSGVKSTIRLIKDRFFWVKMSSDISQWCRECLICQQNKVNRHTSSALTPLQEPNARFHIVHMDIVGPLPVTLDHSGAQSPYRYLVTFIDRYSRWIEAVPVAGISAEEISGALLDGWISRFGVPLELITDRGAQFESDLFKQLSSVLGFMRIRTSAYHPQSNGLLERQHRRLKCIIRAHGGNWLQNLPLALFAMRITPSDTTNVAPFTMLTGANILAPTQCFDTTAMKTHPKEFVARLATRLENFKFSPPCWNSKPRTFVPKELQTCKRVWVRIDRVKRPLEAPYQGPFEVIARQEKTFIISLPSGKTDTISIDRLKPCLEPVIESCTHGKKIQVQIDNSEGDDLPITQYKQDEDTHDMQETLIENAAERPNHSVNEGNDNVKMFANRQNFKTRYGRTVRFRDIS